MNLLHVFLFAVVCVHSMGSDPNSFYFDQCEEVREYGGVAGNVRCHESYHLYESEDSSDKGRFKLRISAFNLFQPGNDLSEFKDYEILAKFIDDNWDLVMATELVPFNGKDRRHNKNIINYSESGNLNMSPVLSDAIALTQKEWGIKVPKADNLIGLYKVPGYVKVLNALRERDPSWSLILSPVAEGADGATIVELAGYYYRNGKLEPTQNNYCHKYVETFSMACLPYFNKRKGIMKKNFRDVFTRRPFLASFKTSSREKINLLATHITYEPPGYMDSSDVVSSVFGVEDIDDLGKGVNKSTYVRFAQIKTMMDFTEAFEDEFSESIIIGGDFNLESKNAFWKTLLKGKWELLVDEKTTLSTSYTNAFDYNEVHARDYDHFLFKKQRGETCRDPNSYEAKAVSFLFESISYDIDEKYEISSIGRKSKGLEKELMKTLLSDWTVRSRKIAIDEDKALDTLMDFRDRVLNSQVESMETKLFYREIMSDHIPVELVCDL